VNEDERKRCEEALGCYVVYVLCVQRENDPLRARKSRRPLSLMRKQRRLGVRLGWGNSVPKRSPDGRSWMGLSLSAGRWSLAGSSALDRAWSLGLLNEIGDVDRHLLDLGVVEGLDVLEDAFVVLRDEVDRHALSAETTAATDSVDVILPVAR